MSRVIKFAKTVRNNWKKSVFATVILSYGATRLKHYIDTNALMRVYCEKAAEHGQKTILVQDNPRNIIVILNPNANKRKSAKEFEKYCAPLLHLAGINVEIIKTESEGHAKTLVENLSSSAEAIVVAGGDGTLSDVVTGLLRRTNEDTNALVPVGVLPLGKINSVAKSLFPTPEKVRLIVDATMAVIEEVVKPIDAMKIEILDDTTNKPVYAVGELKWGAYRDAEVRKDSYWYFGGFKKYATYVFNGIKSSLTWNCDAVLTYNPPCDGCSNCHKIKPTKSTNSTSWLQRLVKDDQKPANTRYLSIYNPDCQKKTEKQISTTDFTLFTSNLIPSNLRELETPKLHLKIGPTNVDYLEFVTQGWRSEQGQQRTIEESIDARTVEIVPKASSENSWYSIDNEDYEVRPVRVTLLPKILNMYCRRDEVML